MKTKLSMLFLVLAGGASWGLSGCKDISCDPELTRTDPSDPTKKAHLVVGKDGLCHWPWYDEDNWGTKCSSNDDCGGKLICLAPDLPMCSQINCNPNPKKDTVCGPGFICIETGEGSPTACIPGGATGSGGSTGSGGGSASGGTSAMGGGGGMGGEGTVPSTGGAPAVSPNVGASCSTAGDPVCVGGTFCEDTMLKYCTVVGCASAGSAKDICDGASADGFMCLTAGPGVPPTGICYKP